MARLLVLTTALLLGFLNKPAFEKWYKEHRGRIHSKRHSRRQHNQQKPLKTNSQEIKPTTHFATLVEELSSGDEDSTEEKLSGEWLSTQPKPKFKYEDVDVKDRVFAYEKLTTGFFEDLRLKCIIFIDSAINFLREYFKSLFASAQNFTVFGFLVYIFSPRRWFSRLAAIPSVCVRVLRWLLSCHLRSLLPLPNWLAEHNLDTRKMKDIVMDQGYPYERYTVTTEDGYILTLERLPNRESKKVLYLQHGVMDNSFTWFAHVHGQGGLAFTAHDCGYDIWVGTLRGCEGSIQHVNKNITPKEYWNFTVNEHAFLDFPAFINKIVEIKNKEFTERNYDSRSLKFNSHEQTKNRSENPSMQQKQNEAPDDSTRQPTHPFDITVVAHSMGAMACLMYMIKCKMDRKEHHLQRAILLSPAGYHKTAPLVIRIAGPIIYLFLKLCPSIYAFRFPSEFTRALIAKLVEDINRSYSMRNLISYFLSIIIGGQSEEHTFVNIHNMTYNIFTGTSVGIVKHFYQLWRRGRFQAYDYGKERNLKEYGQEQPIDFFDNYDKIDIPIYFVMGLSDTLIQPVSVIAHYFALEQHHPELAHLKAIPKIGHIDFTVGMNEILSRYILEVLQCKKDGPIE